MLNSIIEKLKDKTVVMSILGYVLAILTSLGVTVNSSTVTVVVVSLCSILTIMGIMHDSGSKVITGDTTSENTVSKAQESTSESTGSETVVSAGK